MFNNVTEVIYPTSNLSGEIWECGTFRGDAAIIFKNQLNELKNDRIIRMFDTFTGQPFSGPYDTHKQGSMNGTSFNIVMDKFSGQSNFYIYSGIMPLIFSGLENKILSVSNIDVDNYDSVKDCLEFVYPRTESGGYIFIDDYGCPSCPGARKAANEFFANKKENILGNSPAYIIKQ